MATEAPITREEMDSAREEKETPQEEPETTEGEETPETLQEEQPEEKSKELQSALAQKEHYRTKLEKAQKELAQFRKNTPPDVNIPTSTNPLEVVRLAKALEGYNEDEVSFITRNATDKSIDGIINATKDDWVKTAIESKREKVAENKGTPSPTSPSSGKMGKTDEELKKMSNKEYNKFISEQMRGRGGNRGI